MVSGVCKVHFRGIFFSVISTKISIVKLLMKDWITGCTIQPIHQIITY